MKKSLIFSEGCAQTTSAPKLDTPVKEVLTSKEAAQYMGISLNDFYKLSTGGKIPCIRLKGKTCLFKRKELDQWLSNPKHSKLLNLAMRTQRLDVLADCIAAQITANLEAKQKGVLTSAEAAQYMGCSKSYLYKLTMNREIPHYKAQGKMSYFKRDELDRWLTRTRIKTNEEIAQEASDYYLNNAGRI